MCLLAHKWDEDGFVIFISFHAPQPQNFSPDRNPRNLIHGAWHTLILKLFFCLLDGFAPRENPYQRTGAGDGAQVLAASDNRNVGLSGESCLALPYVNTGLGWLGMNTPPPKAG